MSRYLRHLGGGLSRGLGRIGLLCVSAAAPLLAMAYPIGEFEVYSDEWVVGAGPEHPALGQGQITLDGAHKKIGKGALRLDADFSRGGGYVEIRRRLNELDITGVEGWVCGDGVAFLGVRAVDATGQTFQSKRLVRLTGSKRWERLSITLDQICASEHWGGADDGVWHGPGRSLAISVSRDALAAGGTVGSVWLDGLSAPLRRGSPPPAAPVAVAPVVIDACRNGTAGWSFVPGSEFPGATGGLAFEPTSPEDRQRRVRLDADFSGGGAYVAAHRKIEQDDFDLRAVRMRLSHSGVSRIGLRLIDGTDQCHQMQAPIMLKPGTEWQDVTVLTAQIVGGEHWGGANDGVWHPPLKGISIVIPAAAMTADGKKASLWFDAIHGVVTTATRKR